MIGQTGAVRVEDAHLWYGRGEAGTYALRGVTVIAEPGEILMVKGPIRKRQDDPSAADGGFENAG